MPLLLDLAGALGVALDHADHGHVRHGELARMAAIRVQEVDIVADRVAAHLDAAVIGIDGLGALHGGLGIGEGLLDLGMGGGPFSFRARR